MRIGVHQHIRRSVSCGALNGLHIAARDHQLIGGHWNGADRERRCGETPGVRPAIRDLMPGTKRFGELKESIGHVTQKVLTAQLRQMEESGLLTRKVYAEVPPRVEYALTEMGESIFVVFREMRRWGLECDPVHEPVCSHCWKCRGREETASGSADA